MTRCGSSGCSGRRRPALAFQRRDLAGDAVRPEIAQQIELAAPRGLGATVGEVDDLALVAPSIAACGASTKLFRPSESQW